VQVVDRQIASGKVRIDRQTADGSSNDWRILRRRDGTRSSSDCATKEDTVDTEKKYGKNLVSSLSLVSSVVVRS
jgi:hypothetical protein